MTKINILGTIYEFKTGDLNERELAEADGICELYDKQIMVRKPEYMCGNTRSAKMNRFEHVVRHEIIHAVAKECGVPYVDDEDLVDWIAHIIPIVNDAAMLILQNIE